MLSLGQQQWLGHCLKAACSASSCLQAGCSFRVCSLQVMGSDYYETLEECALIPGCLPMGLGEPA